MLIEGALLERICEKCKRQKVLFVLDECFLDFVAEGESLSMKPLLESNPYLFILRAFTKRYAMAGLRLGYSMTSNQELQESENLLHSRGAYLHRRRRQELRL